MGELLVKLFNMSVTASWIVLAVILFRLIFRRAPRWIYCLLWSFAGLRLILPFSVQSSFSAIPSTTAIDTARYTSRPYFNTGISALNSTVNDYLGEHYFEGVTVPANNFANLTDVLALVWLAGVLAMAAYGVISYIKIKKRVAASVSVQDMTYICDDIDTPFILGVVRPRIYLPSGISDAHRAHVLSHERAHLRRCDHLWKPLGFVLLSLYWFNPLMWVAYVLLCRDIESACDEKVVRDMDTEAKKSYSEALAFCGVQRKMIAACPLAFGEVALKDRIKSVLSYKKPAFWIIIIALAVSVIAAVCLLTDPMQSVDDELAEIFDRQIHWHNESAHTEGNYCAVDWKLIGKSGVGDTVTYYMWALYQEYSGTDASGELIKESGSHILTAIRVKRDGDEYKILEYWEPKDGSYYRDSITDKVPFYLWSKAFDSRRYIDAQKENCERAAKEYFSNDRNLAYVDSFTYEDGPDPFGVSIGLMPDGTYTFTFSLFSSHFCVGDYSISDGYLKLSCRDADHIWMFKVAEEGFVFDASRSSEMPKFKYRYDSEPEPGVADGALFVPNTIERYYPYSYLSHIDPNRRVSDNVVNITDLVTKYGLAAGDAEDVFFEDEIYIYIFPTYKRSEKIIVTYDDGSTEMLSEAMTGGRVTIADLESFGIEYMSVSKTIRDIVYHSDRGGKVQMLELFYEDDTYEYYFPDVRSDAVIVYFVNGEEIPIKDAMSSGRVTPKDLDLFGIKYYKEVK